MIWGPASTMPYGWQIGRLGVLASRVPDLPGDAHAVLHCASHEDLSGLSADPKSPGTAGMLRT